MARYQELVSAASISEDAAQLQVVRLLDELDEALATRQAASERQGFLSRLFSGGKAKQASPKGLYIWGSVGRGKTMLMDLFFEGARELKKQRSHFHEFMEDVHNRVYAVRQKISSGELKDGDPILPVADEIANNVSLLCFDEFTVTDIADAMLLGRLFTRLFEKGVVIVVTSNVVPDNLYKDGLNRNHILPFIALLKERTTTICLDSPTDYRLEKLGKAETYIAPCGPQADEKMQQLWEEITMGLPLHREELHNKGRVIPVIKTCSAVAWFTFDELCVQPLGASDYLRICRAYHTIFLSGVPVLSKKRRNEAKRFINLIDTLYDNHRQLVICAAAEPTQLYISEGGTEAFEFDRTASRLIEMRSREYLLSRKDL